jgi:hypothetical protein
MLSGPTVIPSQDLRISIVGAPYEHDLYCCESEIVISDVNEVLLGQCLRRGDSQHLVRSHLHPENQN